MAKPVGERTHRRLVEAGRTDAYRSRHAHINEVEVPSLTAAWRVVADVDKGLAPEPPEGLSGDAIRAIIGLARLVEELRYDWS